MNIRYLLLTLVLASTPVFAQQSEVMVAPTQLDIVEKQGSIVTRNLLVSYPIGGVQLIPPNFYSANGTQILPSEVVQIPGTLSKTSKQCEAVELETITPNAQASNKALLPLCFDLKKAKSGEFASQLQVTYQGKQQFVPITVKIQHDWPLPLIVLVLGIVMGIEVSTYRSQGQPRDEILVRVGQLRAEIQEDTELVKAISFKKKIEAYLYDVKVGLQSNKLENAQNGIEQGEKVWAKWVKGRVDWLNQFTYWEEMNQRLQDLDPNIPYLQALNRQMEAISQDAADLEGPDQLRDRLDELGGQLNRFLQVQGLETQSQNLLAKLPPEEKENWQLKIITLNRKIEQIQPTDTTEMTTMMEEMEEAIAAMTQLIPQSTSPSITKGIFGVAPVAPAPSARPLNWQQRASGAKLRLQWFTWGSYAIALIFLTGVGFNQLYVNNPIFGASPWQDYFSLLAWGFGAEATRDSVTKMLKGWDLSGFK